MDKTKLNSTLIEIREKLLQNVSTSTLSGAAFCKTGPGSYAEHDKFMGINVPTVRLIAKDFINLDHASLSQLIASEFNEERLLALFILIHQYNKAKNLKQAIIYNFYMDNLRHINNWNLVDSSAHLILGAHTHNADKTMLITLSKSTTMWERRIAIVATWYFIRKNNLEWTFKISEMLLGDSHDLIHKAVGWMLREAGKKNLAQLITFLDQHATKMPRTMLRYAIEKFPEPERKKYLKHTLA